MDPPPTQPDQQNFFGPQRIVYDGKRMRKPIQRKTVDYGSVMIKMMEDRVYQRDFRDRPGLEPHADYIKDMLPPSECSVPVNYACKFVHTSTNKVRCPVNCVVWTPEGRRLLTGSSSGEFTLWSGLTFNFETILQAHDSAVRSMIWSHNNNWMISGDHGGTIKYWQVNMNNVKAFPAHKEAVRDLSFCPTDLKFVSGSDDVTLKVWDFATCREEFVFTGHGWDVKSVSWHPQKSIIASGSKDNLIKFWDAKSGRNINTLHGHKNTVLQVTWNDNGNWLLSASRDQFLKLWDMRTMKEIQTFKGHKKEVTSCTWHPVHEGVFTSGGFDGHIYYWIVGTDEPQAEIAGHESSVWDLAWHPIGHILASGSNDHTTKFWCRNRPGDNLKDKYTLINGIPMVVEEGEEKPQEPIQPQQATGMNLPGIGRVEYKKQDPMNPPPQYQDPRRSGMQPPPRSGPPPPQRRPNGPPGPYGDFGNQPQGQRPMNQGFPPQGYPPMPPNMGGQFRMPPNGPPNMGMPPTMPMQGIPPNMPPMQMGMPPNPQFMMGYPPNPMPYPSNPQQYNPQR